MLRIMSLKMSHVDIYAILIFSIDFNVCSSIFLVMKTLLKVEESFKFTKYLKTLAQRMDWQQKVFQLKDNKSSGAS